MLEKHLILAEIGLEEYFAGKEEKCSFGPGILVAVEVLFNDLRDLQLTVGVVCYAVLSYIADLLLFELEVLQCVLKVIEVHIHKLYKENQVSHNQPRLKKILLTSIDQQSFTIKLKVPSEQFDSELHCFINAKFAYSCRKLPILYCQRKINSTFYLITLLYRTILALMGNCVKSDPPVMTKRQLTNQRIHQILSITQVSLLTLIFQDLAQRIKQRKINLQNFLLFFHKNGFWGSQLFKEFDHDETQLISREEFMMGIAKIFKSSERDKISLLFKFFAQRGAKDDQGVPFQQFLIMLYNYPKEELKDILDDPDFFQFQLKKTLVEIDAKPKGKAQKVYRLQSIAKADKHQGNEKMGEKQQPTLLSQQICRKISVKQQRVRSNSVSFHQGEEMVEVRTTSLQRLVKRYAARIFRQAKTDIHSGRLGFQHFYSWITRHKRLYQAYYDGFHNRIWESDNTTKKPQYMAFYDRKSTAKLLRDKVLIPITIFLQHSVLVICSEETLQKPLAVVCLEGLTVQRISVPQGCGFSITHRDGIYKEKRIFFESGDMTEWIQLLRYYDGQSIQQKYEICEKIGTGKFSFVFRCKSVKDGKEYALKEIATHRLQEEVRSLIAHESAIMRVISHPLLLEFKQTVQTKNHVYIVTELVKGRDLFDFVRDFQYLQEYQAAQITLQLIIGVRFLHSFQIVHRDLKPENIMVVLQNEQEVSYIKIIDFGFSDYLSSLKQKSPLQLLTGTPNYIAPEILKQQGINFKIDNFAIGSILYFMLTGNLAFNDKTVAGILQKTIKGEYQHSDKVPLSKDCKDLIDRLLKNNPDQRISLEEALHHPWFEILKLPQAQRPQQPQRCSSLLLI